MSERTPTILFVSSEHKGDAMLRAAKAAGCHVLLLTEDKLRDRPWPRESIDEFFFTPSLARYQDVMNTVTYLARGRHVSHVQPLDEFELEICAMLREHMRLPGMGTTDTRRFRDKLTMRGAAQAAGLTVPPFTRIVNYDELRDYFERVPPPWVLKPRAEAGSMGIRKLHDSEPVWRALDELGDRQSYYLLEQYIPGEVYHVDAFTLDGRVEFASAQKYGRPPMDVYQGGGVFYSRVLPRNSAEAKALLRLNEQVIKGLGHVNGPTHAEFIRAADGTWYFLEIAARVGGAFISDMLEHAAGINLWAEWGRYVAATLLGQPYTLPRPRKDYGGVLVTLARQERPDLSGYADPEIVWRADKPYHAGLIVAAPKAERVQTLLDDYARRFAEDFLHVGQPMGVQRTGVSG